MCADEFCTGSHSYIIKVLVMILNQKYLPSLLIFSLIVFFIAIDIAVPSFPDMVSYFSTTEQKVQWTLSMNFLGFCISGLLYGPISDSFGRRPIMLVGGVIFTLGSLGNVFAESIELMICSSFVQGMGTSSAGIVVYAMIADLYEEEKAAKFLGVMNFVLAGSMAGAPIIGSLLVNSFGWRASFVVLSALSIITLVVIALFLPETHTNRPKFSVKQVLKDYASLFSNMKFMVYTIAPSLMFGAYMAYVGGAPFLYVTELGLSTTQYGVNLGIVLASFAVVSIFTGKLNTIIGMNKCIKLGAMISVTAALIMLVMGYSTELSHYWLTGFMAVMVIGIALCFGSAVAKCLSLSPGSVGIASSGNVSLRLIIASICVWIGSAYYDGTVRPLVVLMFICLIVSAILLFTVARKESGVKLSPAS